jgi:hypothetical protein
MKNNEMLGKQGEDRTTMKHIENQGNREKQRK